MVAIRFYKHFTVDDYCGNMDIDVIDCISHKTAVYNVYAVCVSSKGNCLFEILDLKNLFKDCNVCMDYGIVAIVHGKKTAVNTVCKLICDWIEKNDSINGIRDFYIKNCH